MILDKSTGNLIIDEKHTIKAGMSIDEIKNSNIKELLSDVSKTEIEADRQPHLSLKTIVVDGMDVDDAARKCHFNQIMKNLDN
ncbi:hypothetical protein [Clostridium psychrophilum]|uniref:hypothetical protein n=1 Tax=Clostridium psychrophilum TaxID=132926 RepID=UPI001C0C8FE8|nr:hypothetical protein [Clostridium psychrophilum]MBU3181431.1 hypothetical protein [Clostridium psychrophilum]